MNLCNKSAVWRSECTTDIQSLCFPSPLLFFSIALLIVHTHFMGYVHANRNHWDCKNHKSLKANLRCSLF